MTLAIMLASAASLGLAAAVFVRKGTQAKLIAATLPIGAGVLLAAALFDLLPEAIEHADVHDIMMWLAIGFLVFFLLERLAPGFHRHHEHDVKRARDEHQNRSLVSSDLLHHCIDGMAIGAAFLVSIPTGVVTVLAVALHEVPKELGTFGILLSRGWSTTKAVVANAITAIGTVVTAVVVYMIGADVDGFTPALLALTAGLFIYIAASDIIPDIHEQPRRRGRVQAIVLVATVVAIAVLIETVRGLAAH